MQRASENPGNDLGHTDPRYRTSGDDIEPGSYQVQQLLQGVETQPIIPFPEEVTMSPKRQIFTSLFRLLFSLDIHESLKQGCLDLDC